MNSQQLTRLIAGASPIGDADLSDFDFESAGTELIQDIVAAPRALDDTTLADTKGHRERRRLTGGRVIAALAVAAAVIAAVIFGGNGSIGGDDRPAFAAEAIKVAQANPRLLVTESGWSVTRADEFTTTRGEMIFSDGQNALELFWNPANQYHSYLRDRTVDSSAHTEIDVLGQQATMFRYDDTATGSPDFTTLIPPQGETFVEVRGDALGSEDAYRELLNSLQSTDVDTWLAAMPPSVVRPSDRAAVVDQMLKGIPIPPGFDVDALKQGDLASDRYSLGHDVAGAIACAWLDRWTAGAQAGDWDEVRQAKEALATSRHWPILLEMNRQGDYPEEIWDWASDRRGSSGFGPNTARNYNPALGCRYIGR